jgi:hypothetical protein
MRLLCVLGEDMQHRIIFEMLFMNHKWGKKEKDR